MRAALVTELRQAGVTQVLEAENGRSALALFRSNRLTGALLFVACALVGAAGVI